MFLSREIDIQLSQNYTKTYLCKILYKIYSIKYIQEIRIQSENNDIPKEPEKLKFPPNYYLNFIIFQF